ncbi:hypothetical protein PTI98_012416 [Pleurotus ostreatus]|nr:hypothetical protein PTI98_012416 [Pleurotus ostreatus]
MERDGVASATQSRHFDHEEERSLAAGSVSNGSRSYPFAGWSRTREKAAHLQHTSNITVEESRNSKFPVPARPCQMKEKGKDKAQYKSWPSFVLGYTSFTPVPNRFVA